MRKHLTKLAISAILGFALAFTFSCHDGPNDDPVGPGGSSSSVTIGTGVNTGNGIGGGGYDPDIKRVSYLSVRCVEDIEMP